MRALEYFVQHEGRRAPFLQWLDNAVAEPSPEITQPKERGEFTVVLQTGDEMKIEVISKVRRLTRLGMKEAKDLVEGAPKNVKEGVGEERGREDQGCPRRGGGYGRDQAFTIGLAGTLSHPRGDLTGASSAAGATSRRS